MLVLTLLSLVLSVLVFRQSPGSVPSFALACLAVAALLDFFSQRLGRLGFFALGAAATMAVAILFPKAKALALGATLVTLLLRTATRGAPDLKLRPIELLVDYFCAAAAVASVDYLPYPMLTAPLAYAFLYWVSPSLLLSDMAEEYQPEWSKYRSSLYWGGLCAGAATLVLCHLNPATPWSPLGVGLLLFFVQQSVKPHLESVDLSDRRIQQRQTDRTLTLRKKDLDEASERIQKTGEQQLLSAAELEVRLETYKLVESMLEGLSGQTTPEEVGQTILDRVRRKVPVQTLVLFWKADDSNSTLSLAPLCWRTPQEERLKASALLQTQEPVVERALRLQNLEVGLEADNELQRIFPEEKSTCAIPMRHRGILYLGHPSPFMLDERNKHFLQVLCTHSVVALESAQFYQRLQRSLQREASAASRNEALVQRLAQVIDEITQLVKIQTPAQMIEHAANSLQQLVPHQVHLVWRAPNSKAKTIELRAPLGPSALDDYAARVFENGRPLLLESFSKGGDLNAPVDFATSLLAVPMTTERGVLGSIVLVRCGGAAFSREDQDILSVLGYQLAAALSSAQMFEELQETHKALKESQAQVVQSSKMAAIGQLAGGVAHELNTPLGAIALAIDGAINALQSKPERAESRLQRASHSVSQMKEIVSKLLFYSRDARSGRRETNLNTVIGDTLHLIGHQLKMDRIEVETQLSELPSFMANQNELQQVFTNLCMNARDAILSSTTTQPKILITTSSVTDPQGETWLRATVRDWGCGIPKEVVDKIFDPFFTTKDVGKGTGLGLSVTMELLEQHGAKIEVSSAVGQGTQFVLHFPQNPPEPEG